MTSGSHHINRRDVSRHSVTQQRSAIHSRNVFGWLRSNWVSVLFLLVVCFALSARALYTSPDDENYVLNFAGQHSNVTGSAWSLLIEEPLWFMYAASLGDLLGPEGALRVTIFLSTLAFLLACTKLSRGAWIFVLIVFAFDISLATLYYYIQIRIGLAISIFLLALACGVNPLLAAIFVSFIHSAFFAVVPCVVLAQLSKSKVIWYATLGALVAALVLVASGVQFATLFEHIDLGRRTETWQWGITDNIWFYVWALARFSMALPVVRQSIHDKRISFWTRFVVIFFLAAVIASTINEAAGRYVAISNIFAAILIGANIRTFRGKLGAAGTVLMLFAFLANEYAKGAIGFDSWFARWALILT